MAVVRSITARMVAETSNWESGMRRASTSLAATNAGILSFKEELSSVGALTQVAGKGFVYTSETTERLAREQKQAEFAARGHAKEAKHLMDVIKQLAAAENASIAITKQATAARNAAAGATAAQAAAGVGTIGGGVTAGLGGLASIAKLAKGGGILLGVKLLANEFVRFADSTVDAKRALAAGEISTTEMQLQMGKSLPIIGRIISGVESIREAMYGSVAEAKAVADAQARQLQLVIEQKRVQEEARRKEQEFNREYIKSQKEKARAAAEAGEAYRAEVAKNRAADEEALRRRRFGNFDFIKDMEKFLAEQRKKEEDQLIRGIQRSVEIQEEANKKQPVSRRSEQSELQASLFGSSAAASAFARASGNNAAVLDELRKIRMELMKKPKNTLEVRDLN